MNINMGFRAKKANATWNALARPEPYEMRE